MRSGHGRRYRYYVSGRLRKSQDAVPDSWRIPAVEIECIVRMQAIWMPRYNALIAGWIKDCESPALIENGMQGAGLLIEQLAESQSADHQCAMKQLRLYQAASRTCRIGWLVDVLRGLK